MWLSRAARVMLGVCITPDLCPGRGQESYRAHLRRKPVTLAAERVRLRTLLCKGMKERETVRRSF